MLYAGIDWPEGWQPGDPHATRILGPRVYRTLEDGRDFRVRRPRLREAPPVEIGAWIAEYVSGHGIHRVAVCQDPLVACGLCLLFDTTEADAALW